MRGEPEGSRLRTGAADDETEVAGEEGRKYVGVVGDQWRQGRVKQDRREGHPLFWRRD